MTTFVDTNVLIDILQPAAEHHEWSKNAIEAAKLEGPVIVSDAVYSEFSVSLDSVEAANDALDRLALVRRRYSDASLFKAGKAYAVYRKNRGQKLNVLPDFFIGALADDEEAPLVTRDPAKIRTYFPQVRLITP